MKSMTLCAAAGAATVAFALTATSALADQCSYKTSEARATDPDQIILMMDSRNAVKTKLEDPHAAFRDIYFCKTPRDQIAMACGEVRSARTKGYVRFLSGGRPDMTSWDGDGKDGFDSAWNRFCKP
jgi:hypothetical protein